MGNYFSKAKLCQMELTVVQWEETPQAEREVSLSHQPWQGLRMEEWRASTQGQAGLIQGQVRLIQGQVGLIQGQVRLVQGQAGLVQGQAGLVRGKPGLDKQARLVQGQAGLGWASRAHPGSSQAHPEASGAHVGISQAHPETNQAHPGTSQAASCLHIPRLYSWMLKPWKIDCTTIPHALPPLTIEPLRDHYSLSTKWVQSKCLTDTKTGGLF